MDLNDRLEEISRNGLGNAHTIDFSKEYENSKQILEKGVNCKEWSEEDEDAIQQAILALEDRYDEHEPNLHFLGYKLPFNKAAERLKSLRPQPQGVYKIAIESILKMCESYEKKGIFTEERAIDFLGNVRVKCKDAIECAPILDEPSWKPSEEQMNYLCAAVDAAIRKHNESVSGYKPARVLKSLYEDLQKLM